MCKVFEKRAPSQKLRNSNKKGNNSDSPRFLEGALFSTKKFAPSQKLLFFGFLFFGVTILASGTSLCQEGELSAAEDAERQAWADDNFEAIMAPQNAGFRGARASANKPPSMEALSEALNSLGYLDGNAAIDSPAVPEPRMIEPSSGSDYRSTVEVPLDQFTIARKELNEVRERLSRVEGPTVTLGSSVFTGRAIKGALELNLTLQVTLGKQDAWKTVPLVGDDVVVVEGSADGKPLSFSRLNGYHVWVTKRSGEITVELKLLVPSRGPRGSIEYDFLVARTPVTRFSCSFPVEGLEPRLDAAVQTDVVSEAGTTRFEATLKPTTRIHIVGYKDMGESEATPARVFAESLSLVSIDENALELFAVVSYTILYSGTKHFDIVVPEGMTVVSADGEGAFRYNLEEREDGTVLLRGETAFPIRNSYEVSLRLSRQTARKEGDKSATFDVPILGFEGVERANGWLAVEVPGKLKIGEVTRSEISAVDVRQLPSEMVKSAISPIIKAYRFHSDKAKVQLSAAVLPEVEPASGSVDRIRAFSVVSSEGKVLTDMRITLRNRLKPNLSLNLPKEVNIRSVHLDGEAITPSRSEDGRLVLPLKRSEGGDRLEPFTVQVVLENHVLDMGLFGSAKISLPVLDLPSSTVAWTVFLPAKNLYSALEGDLDQQQFAMEARWHQSAYSTAPVRTREQNRNEDISLDLSEVDRNTGSGLMGVRIELPRSGSRLDHERYWVESNSPIEVSFSYVRGWLTIPAGIVLALILGLGCFLFVNARQRSRKVIQWTGAVLALGVVYPLYLVGDTGAVLGGIVLGLAAIALGRKWHRRVPSVCMNWAATLWPRFKDRPRDEKSFGAGRIVKLCLVGTGMFVFGLVLFITGLQLFFFIIDNA